MNEIIATLESLDSLLGKRDLKQLALIIEAMFAMTGRVTMQGISRWTENGGSYRTVQRFFKGSHDWSKLRWLLIKQQLGVNLSGTWLIISDEVIVTKSGKQTHGLDKFYSSIQNQPVKALCFLNLSLAHVETQNSYPMITEQLIREDVKKNGT